MAGAFEIATRSAIREIVLSTVQQSKFGFVLSHENLESLETQLFELFVTSRNLKAAGDRMIAQGFAAPAATSNPRPRLR